MSPREVIAWTIYAQQYKPAFWRELPEEFQRQYLNVADAVIDALSSMTITDAMCDAYSEKSGGEWIDANGWRAMVGAMRDE